MAFDSLPNDFERALVLAPHTDDGEFGCGATMARLVEGGCEVHYVAFSAAEESVPAGFDPGILRHEVLRAVDKLGVSTDRCTVLDFKVRTFPAERQRILDSMIAMRRDIAPDIVFLPSPDDTHQDHEVISAEGFRAFKRTTILAYEMPWNQRNSRLNLFVGVDERHLQKKVAAINEYSSQAGRPYSDGSFWRGLAKIRGVQVGLDFAEAFEVIRWVCR